MNKKHQSKTTNWIPIIAQIKILIGFSVPNEFFIDYIGMDSKNIILMSKVFARR